jgi:hypothetical protein
MKHLFEYESYYSEPKLNEGAIPVYNETLFIKNVQVKPDMEISDKQIPAVIEGLLDKVERGEIEKVAVIANIPTQGKSAPQYIRDVMAKERARLGKKYTLEPKLMPEGGRLEKRRTETGETYPEYTAEINVFIDSEYVIQSVLREVGRDYLIGIPISYVYKVENNTSLKEYYSVKISPQYVEEVHYTPSK